MSNGWIIFVVLAGAVLLAVLGRYLAGIIRLRAALRMVARGQSGLPLLLDLPRGLRAAERDLKTLAARIRDLDRAARQEQFDLSAILGSIVEGVFLADARLQIRLGNPGLEKLFDLPGSSVGRTVMEAFRNPDLQRLVGEALREGRPHRGEITIQAAGAARTLDASISPLRLEDGEAVAVAVLHDISRIRNLERVRREFVANVSHELRTPLTIINGYLETLVEGGLDDRVMAEQALRVMFRHGDRLKHLVDDLLVISQAESHAVRLDLEPVDLRDLLGRVIAQCAEPIRAQSAEVRVTSAGGDVRVPADPLRLEQVFLNLLENALRYGPRRGLVVDFQVEREGENVRVQVRDNGPGIPREDQEHIFERFYRVHKDRSRTTGGTGLGLSIVKSLVEAHGGSVSLQSAQGGGSTFHVVLPLEPAAPFSSAA